MTDAAVSNIAEFTVSELSAALKRVIEGAYPYVRVRGELGRVTRAASGHMYLDLKDERAVLSGVVWKGQAARLKIRPEQGLEVIATGRLTTFPGQSRYQIVIESLEPAGVGALMALLEARKKAFEAEGLFAPERKRPIPTLPEVIGVVTSPTGAVIRDILHRLRDRFPRHVLLWPTLVQGDKAAEQIAAAIAGFNALAGGGDVPRPDVLIVARGGGSIEDLWAFNEEIVVRAAAASAIPLISAVGHETDTTLIDYAADLRAPTPTAAAELAVPVRSELHIRTLDLARRLAAGAQRGREGRAAALLSAARALGRAEDLVAIPQQRFDRAADRLASALTIFTQKARARYDALGGRLSFAALDRDRRRKAERLAEVAARAPVAFSRRLAERRARLDANAKLLASLGYEQVLARGFALVRGAGGALIRSAAALKSGDAVALQFADGARTAVIDDGAARASASDSVKIAAKKSAPAKKTTAPKPSAKKVENGQGRLF